MELHELVGQCLYAVESIFPLIAGGSISSPLGSVDILNDYQRVLGRQFSGQGLLTYLGQLACGVRVRARVCACLMVSCLSTDALQAYEWAFCYLWVESQRKLTSELASGKVGIKVVMIVCRV